MLERDIISPAELKKMNVTCNKLLVQSATYYENRVQEQLLRMGIS